MSMFPDLVHQRSATFCPDDGDIFTRRAGSRHGEGTLAAQLLVYYILFLLIRS